MATEPLVGTISTSAAETPSPAQQLMQKHAADESHRPTVEDVVDEEDIVHPPPSSTAHVPVTEAPPSSPTASHVPVTEPAQTPQTSEPMSAKAAGKQREQTGDTGEAAPRKRSDAPLNMQSEEMFPSLGAPKGPTSAAQMWGTKPASVKMNGVPNGLAGLNASSRNSSSRAPTSASGMATPASVRGLAPQLMPLMPLPGQHVESISLVPSQMKPRAQLKKPLPDILRDINKRSKAKVDMKVGAGSEYIFEARGPVDAVRQALNEVADELGSKQSIKVTIPESVRPHIIGRGGANIKNIEKATRARVRVQDSGDVVSSVPDDDSATADVLIEGNALSAEMARRQIEAIVNDRTSTVNLRMRDIPPELYPFLAGAHNSRINTLEEGREVRVEIPQYHTWSGQSPTMPSAGQPLAFAPQTGRSIQISGDREAAQAVKADIERQARELQRRLTMRQEAVDRGRHQFIIGERGGSIHDFLKETGCTVILPPDSDDSDTVTIIGPGENIESGINKVQDMAMSMQMLPVNVAKQHANAPSGPHGHSRNLACYLQQRQAIKQLENVHNAHIVIPPSEEVPWEVYARDGKNAMRARTDLTNLISGHPPTRLMHVNMDPFYHQHVQQRLGQQLARNGVYAVFPKEHEQSPQVMLVYEGPEASAEYQFPRSQPSPSEVKEFESALREAQQLILGMIPHEQQVVSRNIDAPTKIHDKLRRYVEKEQASLPEGQLPVHVHIGKPPTAAHPDAAAALANGLLMRGPSDSVNDLAERITAFILQEERDEKERGYTTTFDFPQKYANYLIGKRGENINKLREEFDVEIKLDDGKVTVQGPEVKAHAARRQILEEVKKWEDQATHVLKIKPQYHGELIGPKGSQINRLQDRYDVRINFPRSAADHSGADAGSEAGVQRPQRANQAQDEVIIKGRKKGADEARDEILSLLQYTMDNSHTATVSVAQSQVPQLIGQGGREMENLRMSTGCQIDVPGTRDAVDPSGRAEIKLKGTKQQVEEAKRLLQERAKVFDNTITRTLDVDRKHHRNLIGAGGSNLRDIVVAAGGPDDRRELARMVRFPRTESDGNAVRVEGNQDVVEKIVAAIEAAVSQRESEVVETLEVAPEKHRLLIGRGGEIRRNLESRFGVGIDIPKQTVTGGARSQVKVSGQPDAVEQAKAHVLSLVKEQEGETILIPHSHHHIVSDNGQLFRRLRNDHRVTVDHAGQQPPPRPDAPSNARSPTSGTPLPLITDDFSPEADNHSFRIIDMAPPSPSAETIPWVLRGSPDNIARARKLIEAALIQAKNQSTTGYLVLPDSKMYRFVVGQGGSTINGIRKETGCRIQVPKGEGGPGEAIEIFGSREGVEQARDGILDAVRRGAQGGRGGRREG